MRGILHQEGIMTLNIDVPNLGAPNFIKHQISLNAIIVDVLSTQLSSMGRSSTFFLKGNTEITQPCNITDQMDLTAIYRTFHPNTRKCAFFSEVHKTSTKIDHIK